MFFDQVHGFKVKWSYYVLKISKKSFFTQKFTDPLSEWFFNLFFNDFERSDPWTIGRPEVSKYIENQFRKSVNSLSEWFINQFLNDFERSDPLSKLGKLCFWVRKAILLELESYAFGCGELCFRTARAMLSDHGSNALDLTEHVFIYL